MELRELNRAFDQFSPTQEQKEAIRARLLHAERKRRPMKRMKKTIAVLAAAALLLMTCAFAAVTGLDQRLLNYLGVSAQEEPLLSPMAVPLDIVVEDSGCTLEVKQVLADGVRTGDIAKPGEKVYGTVETGKLIAEAIK